jgi:hypothetical protein
MFNNGTHMLFNTLYYQGLSATQPCTSQYMPPPKECSTVTVQSGNNSLHARRNRKHQAACIDSLSILHGQINGFNSAVLLKRICQFSHAVVYLRSHHQWRLLLVSIYAAKTIPAGLIPFSAFNIFMPFKLYPYFIGHINSPFKKSRTKFSMPDMSLKLY